MKNSFFLISLIVITMFMGLFFGPIDQTNAQTDFNWLEPINLSNSGASTEPNLVIDSRGIIHVIWVDEFDGYKYVQSEDGVTWTSPATMDFLFSVEDDFPPTFLADDTGAIHVLWLNGSQSLYYSIATSANFGAPSTWRNSLKLADGVVDFDAKVGPDGILHVAYINTIEGRTGPAGVYHRRLSGAGWSAAQGLYSSQYFRSLDVNGANVRLSASTDDIYIAWDDRSRKRVFFTWSTDGGEDWEDATLIQGPEDLSGLELPFNINVNASDDGFLLTWQVGIPGNNCIQYSRSSIGGEFSLGPPVRMIDEFAACPEHTSFITQNDGFLVALLSGRDDFSLIAWNGDTWSDLQTQGQLSTFINPLTLDSVLLSCYKSALHEDRLFVVGCDNGGGGDIWFSSRILGSYDEWFPPASAWTSPSTLASVEQNVSELTTVSDRNNNIHVFWVQSPISESDTGVTSIYYSRWNSRWSEPRVILSGFTRVPKNLSVNTDIQGRLLISWVDGDMGDLYFSWASADRANIATEWSRPRLVATGTQLDSSPDILSDDSGKIIIAYSIPLNEDRGIYIVQTEDLGNTWSKPINVIDAVREKWDSTDHPLLRLTRDGTLHILFNRYSLHDGGGSEGLYYSKSSTGGLSWSQPRVVTENSVRWSQMVVLNDQSLNIVWREKLGLGYATYHQFSRDGGMSWENPTSVSNLSDGSVESTLAADAGSQLHLVQVYNRDDRVFVQVLVWDGSRWGPPDEREINAREGYVEFSTMAGVSSQGIIQVLMSFVYPDPIDESGSHILNISRSVGQFSDDGTIPPMLISTPSTLSVQTEMVDIQPTSTAPSPLSGFVDSSAPSRRNLYGLLLVAAAVIGVFIFILPARRKR